MRSIDEVSEHYVERSAALDPIAATARGVAGHDHALTDYSPDAEAERAELAQATLTALRSVDAANDAANDRGRIATEVLRERLDLASALYDAGEWMRSLRVIGSPLQSIRLVFDLMPRATAEDWETIAARLAEVPQALSSYEASLNAGIHAGTVCARRQVEACTRQADTWGGVGDAPAYFPQLAQTYAQSEGSDAALARRLTELAERATAAYASFGRYLVSEYLPHAGDIDGVGADRYGLWARVFNGADLDLAETYAWGWDELHRIEHAMGEVGERILPGAGLDAVIEHLEHDPHRVIEGEDNLRGWLQDLLDTTITELEGTHFDIPEPVRRVEAMIAPPGGAAAMYYTPPNEDFSRPGRTWYPTLGKTRFPLWGEVSICYHEGVPGHHLQLAHVKWLGDRLTRFQRTFAGSSGHAEGWALYAERLMGELGYLEDSAYELGMLRAQVLRAVRVVVDIGVHLGLTIPDSESFAPGAVWTPELALAFVLARSRFPADFMASEVDRYLGWPGQAISYKVGERVWLAGRDGVRQRAGAAFDLKAFHRQALDLGPMGLDQLERELTRL
jgi:uncharacterized protein (DUF885 family)